MQHLKPVRRVVDVVIKVSDSPSDTAVMAARETMSFKDFYIAQFGRLVALATTICGDSIFAEDIVQEAMTKTSDRWAEVRLYEKPAAWTQRIVVNRSIDRKRRRLRETKALTRLAPPSTKPFTDGTNHETWLAVSKLKPKQRAAIALHYIEGYSTAEIAEILECPTGTARSLLSRARDSLRITLTDDQPPTVGERS